MITEDRSLRCLIVRLVMALPVLVVAWLAILALVLRAGAPASAVRVLFPPDALIGTLGDVAVTGSTTISVTLSSDTLGLVARSYAAGAWLVLPTGLKACIPAFLRKG